MLQTLYIDSYFFHRQGFNAEFRCVYLGFSFVQLSTTCDFHELDFGHVIKKGSADLAGFDDDGFYGLSFHNSLEWGFRKWELDCIMP